MTERQGFKRKEPHVHVGRERDKPVVFAKKMCGVLVVIRRHDEGDLALRTVQFDLWALETSLGHCSGVNRERELRVRPSSSRWQGPSFACALRRTLAV